MKKANTYNLIVISLSLLLVGCTHARLHRNTTRQASTVSDIYQQQVLDNLAKFARDPNAIPHFAIATGGINDVNAGVSGGFNLRWNFTRFIGADTGTTGELSESANWSLTTISDPRKLELMRCAYQKAVLGCRFPECQDCPDCQKRFNHFYTGDPNKQPEHPLDPDSSGSVNESCMGSAWFSAGCESCGSKKHCRNSCYLIGTHCGCSVCVTPGHGSNELAKLTLTILDFAINDPPAKKTKEVVAYLDANGGPATAASASFQVKANVSASGDVNAILSKNEQLAFAQSAKRQNAFRRLNEIQNFQKLDKRQRKQNDTNLLEGVMLNQLNLLEKELAAPPELLPLVPEGQIEPARPGRYSPSILQTPAEQLFQLEQRMVD